MHTLMGCQVEAQKREREGTTWSEEEQAAFKAKIAERCPAIRQWQSFLSSCRLKCSACKVFMGLHDVAHADTHDSYLCQRFSAVQQDITCGCYVIDPLTDTRIGFMSQV